MLRFRAFHQSYRGLIADSAVWSNFVVVSTPDFQFFPCVVKAHEPMRVQTFCPEAPIKGFNVRIVRGFPKHDTDEQFQKDKANYLQLGNPAKEGQVSPDHPEWHSYQPEFIQHRRELQQDYRKMMCDYLCDQLLGEKLIALGKQVHPFPSIEPEIIKPLEILIEPKRGPDEIAEADIRNGGIRIYYESWDKDVLCGRTSKFSEVKIHVPKKRKGNKKDQKNLVARNFDKGGRPSKRSTILEAFELAVLDNVIDPKGTLKTASEDLQKYIEKQFPEEWLGDGSKKPGSGFNPKTIAPKINSSFKSLKEKHS